MSAIAGATAPVRTRRTAAPVAPAPAAKLTVVPTRQLPAGRLPFAVLVGAILLTGLMGLLLVHTLAAQESFRVHDQTQRLAILQDEEQQLAVANQDASTPTALRIKAEDLGMRPSSISDYRTAKDGRVIGTLTAIPVAAPKPIVTPSSKSGKAHHGAAGKAGTAKATTDSAKSSKSSTSSKATKATMSATSTGHKSHHHAGHTGASAH